MPLEVRALTPSTGLGAHIDAIARLRIAVFRDWPYLYDGDLSYEQQYLRDFAASPGAIAICAFDGTAMVGASTGLPMTDAHHEFSDPFRAAGIALEDVFYCAESVLLASHRGRGLYRRFFDGREAHARRLGGYRTIAFCGIVRPDDHPLKPEDAVSLDPVWRHFGYTPRPDMTCRFSWLDIDQPAETEKTLQFWLKPLD